MVMDLARVRLAAQSVSDPWLDRPEEVVGHLGAVQAQDLRQAIWAVGLRLRNPVHAADVEAALGVSVLRTWGMRGTLHLVPLEDQEWMRALFAPRILARTTRKVWEYHRADQALADRAAELLQTALDGGRALPRDDLSALLRSEGVPDDHQQHYFLYAHFSQTGLIVQGPRVDGQDTLTLASHWASRQRSLSDEAGVALLAERYFTSHGPATRADFANWSGLDRRTVDTGLSGAADRLERTVIDRREFWHGPDVGEGFGTYLLPGYDELVIGYRDRAHAFGTHGEVPISTSNGMFFPLVVVDGQVAGTWKRTLFANAVKIELRVEPSIDREHAVEAAHRNAAFHHLEPRVAFGEPPDRVRPPARWVRPSTS